MIDGDIKALLLLPSPVLSSRYCLRCAVQFIFSFIASFCVIHSASIHTENLFERKIFLFTQDMALVLLIPLFLSLNTFDLISVASFFSLGGGT